MRLALFPPMNRAQRNFDCLAACAHGGACAASLARSPRRQWTRCATAAADFVRQRMQTSVGTAGTVHVEAGALDARLRLAPCAQPLQAFVEQRAAAGPAPHRRRALHAARVDRVRTRAGGNRTQRTGAAAGPAPQQPGATAGCEIRAASRSGHRRQLHYSKPAQLAGRHLRNTAAPGTALTVDLLTADVLVKRGQRVTLIASAGGIEVRRRGRGRCRRHARRPRAGAEPQFAPGGRGPRRVTRQRAGEPVNNKVWTDSTYCAANGRYSGFLLKFRDHEPLQRLKGQS